MESVVRMRSTWSRDREDCGGEIDARCASSIDGDLFVHFSFDPVYDPKTRVERK